MDEPSLGIATLTVKRMLEVVRQINAADTTVLLVEQNVRHALAMATRGCIVEKDTIVGSSAGLNLLANTHLRKARVEL